MSCYAGSMKITSSKPLKKVLQLSYTAKIFKNLLWHKVGFFLQKNHKTRINQDQFLNDICLCLNINY